MNKIEIDAKKPQVIGSGTLLLDENNNVCVVNKHNCIKDLYFISRLHDGSVVEVYDKAKRTYEELLMVIKDCYTVLPIGTKITITVE